jgi:sarcosine oxidase
MSRIVVVGAGIVGLSVSRAALLSGHEVTLLEQGTIANPNSASYDQHRMIRYQYGDAKGYTRMVGDAFDAWERLWDDLGVRHFSNTGTMGISQSPGDYTASSLATFRQLGIPHEVLDREAVERTCPQLSLPENNWGLLARSGGALFADRIVDDLACWLSAKGIWKRAHSKAVRVDPERGEVILEDGSVVSGDLLVIACGAWLPKLLPDYVGMPTFRQAVCYVEPPAEYLQAWRNSPCLTDLGPGDNYAISPTHGTGLKFGSGSHRRCGRPGDGFQAQASEGDEVISHFSPFLRQAVQYKSVRMQVGYYVKDASQRFRIDTRGRTIAITNCDGQMFKFGPLIGARVIGSFDGNQSAKDLNRWAAGY